MAGEAMQFKVTLMGIDPPIWRRFLIAGDGTFLDLHGAIQDTMRWDNSHLNAFRLGGKRSRDMVEIGIPSEDDAFYGWHVLNESETPLAAHFRRKGRKCVYVYDFGDTWEHEVVYEGRVPLEEGEECPRCLDGKRAGPPEDCGGIYGYLRLLECMADPNPDEDALDLLEWLGDHDPERFDPASIRFTEPQMPLRW